MCSEFPPHVDHIREYFPQVLTYPEGEFDSFMINEIVLHINMVCKQHHKKGLLCIMGNNWKQGEHTNILILPNTFVT